MAQCVFVDPNGFIKQSVQSTKDCSAWLMITPTEHQLMVQTVDIKPAEIGAVFATSFGWIVFLAYLSYKVRLGKNLVRKI